ncbi:hypothetical protein [Paenibacillus roseipurpureus]|uniref:Uncharacterized protein n=1 Tax=Paenibacillus roseopurpureus TaxID=2918901 RepID=A0AA96LLY7_9BACL|nr:hypothetical protein [Paenibacillus sp. MBLB1832]WNR42234.1 hypothetical protein MJB10_13920 [Paenibacillus sp. MBLB1832]
MDMDAYHFANLGVPEGLMQDLRDLESRMKEELGYDVTLIAYAKENADRLNN